MLSKKNVLLSINEKDGFKDMCSLLKLDIPKNGVAYIIWNYDAIDKIKACILQDYWDYVWYGTSDEMCLLYFPDIESLVMVFDYVTIKSN